MDNSLTFWLFHYRKRISVDRGMLPDLQELHIGWLPSPGIKNFSAILPAVKSDISQHTGRLNT